MGERIKDLGLKQSGKVAGGNGGEDDAISEGIGAIIGYYRKAECESCGRQYKYYSHQDFFRDNGGMWGVKPGSKEDFRYACEGRLCPQCLEKEVKSYFD